MRILRCRAKGRQEMEGKAPSAGIPGTLREEKGFTLPELLVVIFIMSLFLIAVGNMLNSGVKGSSASYQLVRVQEKGNEAVSVMVRQIRGAVAISPASGTSAIEFYADVEGDGVLDMVRFDLAGGYLRKGSAPQGTGSLAMENWMDGCTSLVFRYWVWDENARSLRQWNAGVPGDHLNIDRIDVEVGFAGSSLGGHEIDRVFGGSVTLRNQLQELF